MTRVEAVLAHGKGRVKYNVDLPDKRTGKPRQTDAVIYLAPAFDQFISVECRRQNHKEDVTWIEQLIGKAQGTGSVATIAVSAVDFSESAKTVADQSNITLKTLNQLKEGTLHAWQGTGCWFRSRFDDYNFGGMTVFIAAREEETLELSKGVKQAIESRDWLAPIFHDRPSNKWFSTRAAFQHVPRHGEVFEFVPHDGQWHGTWFPINLPPARLYVDTTKGAKEVRRVIFKLLVRVSVVEERTQQYVYSENSNPVLDVIEAPAYIDTEARLLFYKHAETGRYGAALFPGLEKRKPQKKKRKPKRPNRP